MEAQAHMSLVDHSSAHMEPGVGGGYFSFGAYENFIIELGGACVYDTVATNNNKANIEAGQAGECDAMSLVNEALIFNIKVVMADELHDADRRDYAEDMTLAACALEFPLPNVCAFKVI